MKAAIVANTIRMAKTVGILNIEGFPVCVPLTCGDSPSLLSCVVVGELRCRLTVLSPSGLIFEERVSLGGRRPFSCWAWAIQPSWLMMDPLEAGSVVVRDDVVARNEAAERDTADE